ncbi:hypothetical protein U3516DRAFT_922209 [Neocallimastix sp. 'constans']|jgi:hypothetical protein
MTKDNTDKFKNYQVLLILNWVTDYYLVNEKKFLNLVKSYNNSTQYEKEKFKSFKSKMYHHDKKYTTEVEILEDSQLQERKTLFINDMITIYKNFYKEIDEDNKDLKRYTNILKYLCRSTLLISRKNDYIKDILNDNKDFLTEKSDLLIPPFVLDGYTGFLAFLKKLYDGDCHDKKKIAKYMAIIVNESISIIKEYEKSYHEKYEFPFLIKEHSSLRFVSGAYNIRDEIGAKETFNNFFSDENGLKDSEKTVLNMKLDDIYRKLLLFDLL